MRVAPFQNLMGNKKIVPQLMRFNTMMTLHYMTKCFFTILGCVSLFLSAVCQDRQLPDNITLPDHPRILLLRGEEQSIRAAIAKDPVWKKMHETIKGYCDRVM